MIDEHETLLLATELELVADFDLVPLQRHLAQQLVTIRNSVEGQTHTMWLEPVAPLRTLDEKVAFYVAIVEGLPLALRATWTACRERCLNTGIQSGLFPGALILNISEATLAGVARIGASLTFSVYAVANERPSEGVHSDDDDPRRG